jgi:hypothetical protein
MKNIFIINRLKDYQGNIIKILYKIANNKTL